MWLPSDATSTPRQSSLPQPCTALHSPEQRLGVGRVLNQHLPAGGDGAVEVLLPCGSGWSRWSASSEFGQHPNLFRRSQWKCTQSGSTFAALRLRLWQSTHLAQLRGRDVEQRGPAHRLRLLQVQVVQLHHQVFVQEGQRQPAGEGSTHGGTAWIQQAAQVFVQEGQRQPAAGRSIETSCC